MDTVGTFEMAEALSKHKALTAINKMYRVEDWEKWISKESTKECLPYIAVTAGISNDDYNRVEKIQELSNDIRMICQDVANGYTQIFVETVEKYRARYLDKIIIAGNVVTCEMAEQQILSGADIIKVGIGPGSVCTTRAKAGVGYPQLSAVIECADASHGIGGLIIADGGCTNSGDISKAFGGGADFVMLGGMLAGHDECGGEIIEKENDDVTKQYKRFYGMSSSTAMKKHYAGVASYRASEGKEVLVPYRGPVEKTLLDILGGIRSACSYVGATSLKEMSKRMTFIRVTQQTNDIFGAPC